MHLTTQFAVVDTELRVLLFDCVSSLFCCNLSRDM